MFWLASIVVTTFIFLEVTAVCPPGFKKLGSSCYNFVNHSTTWVQARAICQTFSSELIAIETETESRIIDGTLLANADSTFDPWTDLYIDDMYHGQWKWKASNTVAKFFHWLPGTPSHSGSTGGHIAHCMRIDGGFGYKWNDEDCNARHKFICEASDNYHHVMVRQSYTNRT